MTVIFIAVFFNSTAQITGIVITENTVPIEGVSARVNDSLMVSTNSNGAFSFFSEIELPVTVMLQHPDFYAERITISETGNLRSSNNLIMIVPTIPVAPTTAIFI